MKTLYECLENMNGDAYEFSSLAKEGLAIIEIHRKDGLAISDNECSCIQSACDMYAELIGEKWRCEWRHTSYCLGVYSLATEDENKEIRNSMLAYEEGMGDGFMTREEKIKWILSHLDEGDTALNEVPKMSDSELNEVIDNIVTHLERCADM